MLFSSPTDQPTAAGTRGDLFHGADPGAAIETESALDAIWNSFSSGEAVSCCSLSGLRSVRGCSHHCEDGGMDPTSGIRDLSLFSTFGVLTPVTKPYGSTGWLAPSFTVKGSPEMTPNPSAHAGDLTATALAGLPSSPRHRGDILGEKARLTGFLLSVSFLTAFDCFHFREYCPTPLPRTHTHTPPPTTGPFSRLGAIYGW